MMGPIATIGGVLFLLVCRCVGAEPGPRVVAVEPKETSELFANPGMGWQTFHHFADEDPALAGLPSGSAYFRFYWREIEPTDGKVDFAKIDGLLAHARRAGQKLCFRVMCTGSEAYNDTPDWLKAKGCRGYEYRNGATGPTHWCPDWEDPIFHDAHFRLIRELGTRYDGSPDLDMLDIGSVGLWGEWHMSGTEVVGTGKPVPMPKVETRLAIIDAWRAAFPRAPKAMLIGDEPGLRHAASNGVGWRADCLGDMGGFSKTWNHMQYFYKQQLAKTGAENAWRTGPVAFETCWDMRKWKDEDWDIPFIFDYALELHASYVNNKSAPIPDGTRPEVERLLHKLGYRLVLRRLEHPATVRPRSQLAVRMAWENVGVAPPYRDYRVAWRLIPSTDRPGSGATGLGGSVRGWLPGQRDEVVSATLPASAKPGSYDLFVAVVDPVTRQPAVRLAIEGRRPDGWYRVSKVEVK